MNFSNVVAEDTRRFDAEASIDPPKKYPELHIKRKYTVLGTHVVVNRRTVCCYCFLYVKFLRHGAFGLSNHCVSPAINLEYMDLETCNNIYRHAVLYTR